MKLAHHPKSGKLPPQKVHLTHRGEAHKTFVIAGITVALLIGLSLFFLFSTQFVGKAITGTAGSSVDMQVRGRTLAISFVLPTDVATSAKQEINTLYFELSATGLCNNGVPAVQHLPAWEFSEISCAADQLTVGISSINPARFTVADFTLEVQLPINLKGDVAFTLKNVDAFETTNGNDIFPDIPLTQTFILSCVENWGCSDWSACVAENKKRVCNDVNTCGTEVLKPAETQACVVGVAAASQGENCYNGRDDDSDGLVDNDDPSCSGYSAPRASNSRSGGGGLTCVRAWECGDWGQCINSQQARTCTDVHGCNTTKIIRDRTYPVMVIDRLGMPNATQSCAGGIVVPSVTQKSATHTLPPVSKAPVSIPVPKPVPKPQSAAQMSRLALIAVPAVIVGILLFLSILLHLHKKKQIVYNFDELKQWITKERQAGADDTEIIDTLKEHTHWNLDEIKKTFGELASVN